MTALAHRFALFDPAGEPILNAVGIWTDRDMVQTYAGTVYGHDGSWAACAAEGYTIRRVAIVEAEPDATDRSVIQKDLLLASRAILRDAAAPAYLVAAAIETVGRFETSPHILTLAARRQADIDATPPAERTLA